MASAHSVSLWRHLFFALIFLPGAPVAAAATVSSDEDIFQNAILNLF